MYLIKTLEKKYRDEALKYGKIRIGTINYYRRIEDEKRQDANEGLGNIIWAGKELTAKDHNRLFTPFDHVRLNNGWTIKNDGIPLVGAYPNFNAFAFCFSQIENFFQIKKTSGGKASHCYFITDLPGFINIITKAIRKEGERIIWKYDAENAPHWIEHLKVFDVTYKINYTDESKSRIVTERNLDSFITKQFYPQDYHQKGTSFIFEKEVRTVWVFISTDNMGRVQPLQIPPPDTDWVDLTLGKLPISKWCKRNNFPIKTAKSKLAD